MSGVPESLRSADLAPVWAVVRRHVHRRGAASLGSVATPTMSHEAALTLHSVLGRRVGVRFDLARLESGLVALGVGEDLDDALNVLGAPPSPDAIARRAATARRAEVVAAVSDEIERWPVTWAGEWAERMLRSGQLSDVDAEGAREAVRSVRRLVEHRTELAAVDRLPVARTDVAAHLFGDSHALDDGLLLERIARRALSFVIDTHVEEPDVDATGDVDGRALWMRAGIVTDLVSAPVLTWNLPLDATSVIGTITAAATTAHSPVHLTQFVLGRHPIAVVGTAPVLLVENPRIVEAAAERTVPWGVVATNGNPSGAVMTLVDALLAAGVEVRHHGDFDAAGLAIVGRLADRGCRPWTMDATSYRRALAAIDDREITVPISARSCGPTPWDPELQRCFDAERRIVHEELLIDELLDPDRWHD